MTLFKYEHLKRLVLSESFIFVQAVLSCLSTSDLADLMQLIESKADENFDWDYYKKLFSSDVINSALLRDEYRHRRRLLATNHFVAPAPNSNPPSSTSTKPTNTNSNLATKPKKQDKTSKNTDKNRKRRGKPPRRPAPKSTPASTNESEPTPTTDNKSEFGFWEHANFGSGIISVFDSNGLLNPVSYFILFLCKYFDPEYLFKYRTLDSDANSHPILPPPSATMQSSKAPCLVPTFELFQICFSMFTNGLFYDIEPSNWYVAGGAVIACLMPLPTEIMKVYVTYRQNKRILSKLKLPSYILDRIEFYSGAVGGQLKLLKSKLRRYYGTDAAPGDHPFKLSDVDVMLILPELDTAGPKIEGLFHKMSENAAQIGQKLIPFRTANTITLISELDDGAKAFVDPRGEFRSPSCRRKKKVEKPLPRNVQFILSVLRDIGDHLAFADMDCTACGFDGVSVTCVPRFVRAVNFRCNLIGPQLIQHKFEQLRVSKYVYLYQFENRVVFFDATRYRGFAAQIFELCKHHPRCDVMVDKALRKDMNSVLCGHADKGWASEIAEIRLNSLTLEEANMHANIRSVAGQLHELLYAPITEWEGIRWKWEDILYRTGKFYLPRCYVCGKHFYPEKLTDALCDSCEKREVTKWDQWDSVDLHGRVALITGARIKIGYQIALRLLRSGCKVIAVTRFPNNAMKRYALEPDFTNWKDNLHVYGLDLCNLPSVTEFISHVAKWYPQIDIIINNAAQTIRRPRAYYYTLIEYEKSSVYGGAVKTIGKDPTLAIELPVSEEKGVLVKKESAVALKSIAFSDVALLPEDEFIRNDELFPYGKVDSHGEQLDLRTENSWVNNIEQISVVEALEVQTINSTVPFMIISQLTPALKAAVAKRGSAFVINVSSAEGHFNFHWQNDAHPHTNMAKAALNMMTKSISVNFGANKIYANAVDTGWVTLMTPNSSGEVAPLTERNGATRVLDPIFTGLTQLPIPYGKMFRNYASVPWV